MASPTVTPPPKSPQDPKSSVKRQQDNDGLHKRRGIWHYRLRVDGRWMELSTRTRNYQEARKIRAEATELHRKGQLPTDLARVPLNDLARVPLNKVAEDWLGGRKHTVAPKTYASDRYRLKPVLRAFGGRRLEELVANGGALIRSFQLSRSSKAVPRTVDMELTVIRQILESARLWKRIEDDIHPLREPSGGPGRALTPEEESRLWASATSKPEWAVAYWCGLLAASTTMRGCEIKGLRLVDVDLDGGLLKIRRATTKTDAGARLIPLNSHACWAAQQLLVRAAKLGAIRPEHCLLARRVGTGVCDVTRPQTSWRSAWRKLTRAAGLRGLRFHDLRHTRSRGWRKRECRSRP
jgi:integrase